MFHSNLIVFAQNCLFPKVSFSSKDSRFFFIVNVNRQCYIFSESSHSDSYFSILSKFSKVIIGKTQKNLQKNENRAKIIFIKKKLNICSKL